MKNLLVALTLLSIPACAAAQAESPRQAYILAHDHGWLELAVVDQAIPAQQAEDAAGHASPSRPDCSLELKLNDERFVAEAITPAGSAAPYRIDSGFRVAAPAGLLAGSLTYRRCRGAEDVTAIFPVVVTAGHVTRISFDGTVAHVVQPADDVAVTLESVDARLQEIERRMPR